MRKNFIVKASLFTLILAFMVAGTFAIAAVMNKKENVVKIEKKATTYFFEYQGTPGNENDRTLWKNVPNDDNACQGTNDGCLIEVNSDYTQTNPTTSEIELTQDVPVTSGSHSNPILGDMVASAKNKN